MEAACERVLLCGKVRFHSVESILKKQLDRQPLPCSQEPAQIVSPPHHENVRGPEYFSGPANGNGNIDTASTEQEGGTL